MTHSKSRPVTRTAAHPLFVMEAADWRRQQDQIEFARTVAAIGKGLEQARNGEGTEAREFFERIGAETA